MSWRRRASTLVLLGALLGACSSAEQAAGDAYLGSDGGLSSGAESEGGDGDGDEQSDDTSFTVDLGESVPACDPWAQDCPSGEKCSWEQVAGVTQTRCVPVEPDAKLPGEPCMVFGDPDSGYDDCVLGALCQHVDPRNQSMGICMALCGGSPLEPICEQAGALCHVCPNCPSLCVPLCDPLAQDCAEGFACTPDSGSFACHPIGQFGAGTLGNACEYTFQCEPGFACVDGSKIPDCGAAGCCSPFCSLADPSCPSGMICVPWFDADSPPLPELGICQSL